MAFVGSSTLSSAKVVTTTVYNVSLGTVDTEQSQVLPSSIVGYMIRTRGGSELKLAHVATESGSKYITVPRKATFEDSHSYSGLTLYFQSPQTGDVVEIIAWQI